MYVRMYNTISLISVVHVEMAKHFILLLVLMLVIARFTVSIQSPAERPSCNRTVMSFQDLQTAMNQTETSYTLNYVLCVNLQPDSIECINSSTVIDSISLIITGSSQGAAAGSTPTVKCETKDYSGELSLNEYPLVVTNSSLVIIEGVQFEECMRPLQFNQIQRVELRRSIFRY